MVFPCPVHVFPVLCMMSKIYYDGILKSKQPADVFSLRTLFICLSSALRLWRACFTTVFLDIRWWTLCEVRWGNAMEEARTRKTRKVSSACSSDWDESVQSASADQPHTTRNCKESETRKVDLCWLFWFAVFEALTKTRNPTNLPAGSPVEIVFFLNHCQESTHVLSGHKHRCDYSEEAANTQRHEPDLLRRSRTAPGMILSRTPAKTKWFGLVHGSWLVGNWRCQDQICPTNYKNHLQTNQNFAWTWHLKSSAETAESQISSRKSSHSSTNLPPWDSSAALQRSWNAKVAILRSQKKSQRCRSNIRKYHQNIIKYTTGMDLVGHGRHQILTHFIIKYWRLLRDTMILLWSFTDFLRRQIQVGKASTFFGPQMEDLKCQENTNQQQHDATCTTWLLCIEESLEIHLEGCGPLQRVLSRSENAAPWDDTSSSLAQNLQNRLHVRA